MVRKTLTDNNTVLTVSHATVDMALFVSSLDATSRCPCGYQLAAGGARRVAGLRLGSVDDGLMSGSGGE